MPQSGSRSPADSARQLRHVRSPELEGSELTYVQSWSGAAPPDIRPQLEITLVDFADKTITHRGVRQRLHTGLTGIRTPFESGQLVTRHASETRVRVLALAEPAVTTALETVGVDPRDLPNALTYLQSPILFARTNGLFVAVEARASALELQTRLAGCADEVVRVLSGRRIDRPGRVGRTSAERIRQVLHDRLAEDLTLDDLTQAVSLSRAYVVRTFHRAFGLPPHEYLMQLRVAHARALLIQGQRPTDVAHACGFYDQSHLNRWFRKILGVTPRQYVQDNLVQSAAPDAGHRRRTSRERGEAEPSE